jgi:transposase-like protein
MRVLVEAVMREELEKCVGAAWGECTPERKGYRNGYSTRDLVTSTWRIEDLSVPRDREGQFQTQVFERYGRYEPEVAEALTEMFVSGTSTHKVGKVTEKLMGVALSASAVSLLNQTLTEQYAAWRERRRPRALAHCVPGWHPFCISAIGTKWIHPSFSWR